MLNALLLIASLFGFISLLLCGFFGSSFLLFLYLVPLLLFKFKKNLLEYRHIGNTIGDFYSWIRKNNIFFAMFYTSCTMTIFSLVGSLYPAYSKESFQMLVTLDNAGYASLWLIVPIFVISKIMDKSIAKLSGFIFNDKGLFDPTTNEDNVSLRHKTFWTLINEIEAAKLQEVAFTIGKEYGVLILRGHHSINKLNEFIDKWLETDNKAGLIQNIHLDGTNAVRLLKITNSFAKYHNKNAEQNDKTKICTFLEHYVKGILNAYFEKTGQQVPDIKLKDEQCKACGNDDFCLVMT